MNDSINLKRTVLIQKSVQEVFAAWATASEVENWFAPMAIVKPTVEWNFIVGGKYRIVMELGDGHVHTTIGEFKEIILNEKIVFTWICDAFPDPETLVTVTFRASGSGTEVDLMHERFIQEESRDNHLQGWIACLDGLQKYLMAG
ncbi:MAG: SRPBCC domain-containing protein [Gammaproteobacteria bacterium]|nr:SRPBCC domain-containing protein [Gammaproteobacteria bacterium]